MGVYGAFPTVFFEGRLRIVQALTADGMERQTIISEESPVVFTQGNVVQFYLQDRPPFYGLSGR